MAKYLYGAAVQGIQGFIFETNKLKEIVGASEIVERICTSLFFETAFPKSPFKSTTIETDKNCITGAAGNIKYLFSDEAACKHIVLNFPKAVMEFAPGIQVSQAVVKIEGRLKVENIQELELKLKAQRNKLTRPLELGIMGVSRSRRTGKPGVSYLKNEILDKATKQKQQLGSTGANFTLANKIGINTQQVTYNTEELIEKNSSKSYIAVIHADGNSLGKVIQQLGDRLKNIDDESKIIKAYKNFSLALDSATVNAAKLAFKKTYKEQIKNGKVPVRPIVLGGDDFTIIADSKKALQFTTLFLREFENETSTQFEKRLKEFNLNLKKLTACAGIAFVKAKYPFHYAIGLAEELCSDAKKKSKDHLDANEEVPASIAIHKVESSFHTSYAELEDSVLKTNGINFKYGPYVLNTSSKDFPSVNELTRTVSILKKEGSPASALRKWLSALHDDTEKARNLMDRTIEVAKSKGKNQFVNELNLASYLSDFDKTILHDAITLSSIIETEDYEY